MIRQSYVVPLLSYRTKLSAGTPEQSMSDSNSGPEEPQSKVSEKRAKWIEEGKLSEAAREEPSGFAKTVHRVGDHEIKFLQKNSVRSVYKVIRDALVDAERHFLARTVWELTEEVDLGQSTVSKAIQSLEKAPVVGRMPHATKDNIIAAIPPIIYHLDRQMDVFQDKARLVRPVENTRADGIVTAYDLHLSEHNDWEANNNLELMFRGELMGIIPQRDLDIQVRKDGRGLLDILVTPRVADVPQMVWKDITKRSQALSVGLAHLALYDPKNGYPSMSIASSNVVTPTTQGRADDRCFRATIQAWTPEA